MEIKIIENEKYSKHLVESEKKFKKSNQKN